MKKSFVDFLLFRTLATPVLLQCLFWGGIGGTLYGTWWLYTHGNWAWIMSLVFGTIATRLVFESFIVRFKTYQVLKEISEKLDLLCGVDEQHKVSLQNKKTEQ